MNTKGFTLIELVVVITIMGILATVGVISYKNILKETRDQKRIVNLQTIRSSIELYRSSQSNAVYPELLTDIQASGFVLPNDPLTNNTTNIYTYTPTASCDNATVYCSTYVLTTDLESLGIKYEVTPNTERILQEEDIPTPTPTPMPTPTSVPWKPGPPPPNKNYGGPVTPTGAQANF